MSNDKHLRCSFCGKSKDSVRKFISGPSVYICNECITLCNEILAEDEERDVADTITQVPTPNEIKAVLDQYVIGQERAKRTLSVAVYNHYKRINSSSSRESEVELDKSNILLIGPTGVGKTLLAQTLARILDVPFTIADATTLTEAGYVGEDVENILVRLLQAGRIQRRRVRAGHRLHRRDRQDRPQVGEPEHHPGRLRRRRAAGAAQDPGRHGGLGPASGRPQASAAGIHPDQYQGHSVRLRRRVRRAGEDHPGPHRPAADRLLQGCPRRPPARPDKQNPFAEVEPDDLLRFGLIPELVGRLPVTVALEALDEEALMRILIEPKNALTKQYRKLFEMENVGLTFDPEALRAVAQKALKRGTGARGLRAILEHTMTDIMFDLPSRDDVREMVITRESVTRRSAAAGGDGAGADEAGGVVESPESEGRESSTGLDF